MRGSQPVITCDGPGCGRTKRDANHWFVVSPRRDPLSALYINRFENATEMEISTLAHACSRECALKMASRWMEGEPVQCVLTPSHSLSKRSSR